MTPFYSRDGIDLYCCDCREILPTLRADSVVTDPPYGVELKGKTAKQRDGGTSFRHGIYSGHEDTPEYVERVCVPAISICVDRFARVAMTPGTRCMWKYPSPVDVGCFFSAAGTGVSCWGFRCCLPILYYGKCPYLERSMGFRPNSFGQTYPNDANEINHPCAKPIRMWAQLVERASLEGMTILDPFAGSGTTLVAAWRLGRKAIGVEISEAYCELAAKRIDREISQGRLFEPEPAPVAEQLTFEK